MVYDLLIQLFWASFILIGLSAVLLYKYVLTRHGLKPNKFLGLVTTLHPVICLLFCLVVGITILSPVIILSYFFEWPLLSLSCCYLLMLSASFVILFLGREKLIKQARKLLALNNTQVILLVLVGAPIVVDYILSLKLGAPLYGDAPVQLAKINLFMTSHLTLSDPYYGYNGVVDPRYSTDIMDALQALIGKLLHTTAVTIWLRSYAFYRLTIWLSFFALAWELLPKKYKTYAYFVLALAPITLGPVFIFANLPDRIVFAWICLFIIGLKYWLEKRSSTLLIVASLLSASTHALFALINIGYICLLLAVLWIFRSLKPKDLRMFLLNIAILLVPVAINYYYPNHTNQDQASYDPGFAPPPLHTYGIFRISQLPRLGVGTNIIYLVLLGVLLLVATEAASQAIRILLYILSSIVLCLALSYTYLAVIGYGLVFWVIKPKKMRIVIACLILYYPLIIYDPVFWRLNHRLIPPWVTFRFSYFNVIGLLAPFIGISAYTLLPLIKWGYKARIYQIVAYSMTILVIGYGVYISAIPSYSSWINKVHQGNNARLRILRPLQVLAPEMKNQIVYSNDPNLAILLPGIVTSGAINFQPANEAPMSNIVQRAACGSLLATTASYKNFRDSRATVILTDRSYSAEVSHLASSSGFLQLKASYEGYRVYDISQHLRFVKNNPGVCSIPYGE